MRCKRVAIVLAVLACAGVPATPSARAAEWGHHVGVAGGGNAFGPFVRLYAAETVGWGSGLGCAGIRSVSGVVCETHAGEFVAVVLGGDINAEPYIHNHSAFESFFNGYDYS
jgi:hypothetical protein